MHTEYRNILNTKNTLLVLIIVHIYESVLAGDLKNRNGGNYRTLTDIPDFQSWEVSNNDGNVRLYSELITILERMNVLQAEGSLVPCLKLDRISRQVNSSLSQSTVGIHFYFTETSFQGSRRNAQSGYNTNSDDVKHIVTSGCGSRLSAIGLDALDRKQANSSDKNSSDENVTGVIPPPHSSGNTKPHSNGLSRTQVIVIATCASVIGTFFLIAGIMRLTSFVKRYRNNREQALNVARRASSMGLNGSNMSSGNLRRDSSASKASRQSNAALSSGDDFQVNRHQPAPPNFSSTHNSSSPMHHSDHKPLLPVNSLSHNSEGGSSSHGSLAFIDEESHNRIKGNDNASDSEMESEDDPLLRKSPDSGSSIDVPVPMIFQNVNEVMASRRNTVAYLEPKKEAGGIPSVTVGKKFSMDSSASPNGGNLLIHVNENNVNELDEDKSSSTNGRNGSSNDEHMENVSDAEITSENDKSNSCNSDDNGSIGFDCDTNGDADDNENGKLDNEPGLGEMFAVTSGLTQSDGSLSDNRNYIYGNQTEYALDNHYEHYTYNGFSCPYRSNRYNYYTIVNNDANNSPRTNDLRLRDDLVNGQCLNTDDHSAATTTGNTSNGISPSELSIRSLSISKDSSGEPLLSNSRNSSSPPSGGGYPASGTDNLALVDSGEEDTGTGSAQCTVVPHIVPLAEYHKISPTFSESMDQS